MKRVLIRISALATVVVLGLIAIAHAQRGAQDTPALAASTPSDAVSNPSHAEPITALAAAAPRPLPATTHANPLRAESRIVASEGLPTSGTSSQQEPQDTSSIPPATQPMAIPAHDTTGLSASSQSVPSSDAGTGSSDAVAPLQAVPARRAADPSAPSASLFPRMTSPEQAPNDGGAAEAAPNVADSRQLAAAPAAAEPAAVKADPFARRMAPAGTMRMTINPDNSTSVSPGAEPGRLAANEGSPLSNGSGLPGSKQLEGAQSPQVTVEKLAPAEIQVGKPATFRIKVRNSGQVAAHGVEIHDEIPKGTRLISTTPQASQGVHGELVWSLGTMQPGEEMLAEVQLMPTDEGEIGSVATVRFQAEASARAVATKPELVVETSAPNQVLVGEPVLLSVTVTNPGSGVATGVVIEERIPAGLQHPAGSELEYDIGELKPKESKKVQLQLTAQQPGMVTNVLVARGDANLKAEQRLEIQVLAPQLDLALEGPKRRYLEREAAYTVALSNPGTAPAQHVELVAQLPAGLKFVSANNSGRYNEGTHTVQWQLDELPAQETGTVKLVTMPVEPGEHTLHVTASAAKGVSAEKEQQVTVEGIAAMMFEVVDVNDPVEKGGETTYEIRVVNQGSKAATSVQLAVMLPPQMRPIAAEGPAHHTIDGNRVLFESLSRLAPKADTTYRVRVQCLQAGDLRINVQLVTDEIRNPVTKEEATRVYADE
jgi:uncharacterized repeat protein (TIGR01451 family)